MLLTGKLRVLIIFALLILIVGSDQVSKKIVRNRIDYRQTIHLLNDHLTLTKVENTGAFLSLGNSLPQPASKIILIAIPLVVLAFALYYVFANNRLSNYRTAGLCLIIAGGTGNIIDRILHGSVTDFLHIDFVIFQTGIFNVADLSIMAGASIILLEAFLLRSKAGTLTS